MYISLSSKIPGQPRDELQWEEEDLSFFQDLNKKKVASFILFIQNQNINIFILKMNKKGVSFVFNEIKNKKKWPHLFFGK